MLIGMGEFGSTALLLTTLGFLLLVCALLGRTVERLGIPIIFVFLFLGMLGGSEGIGGLPFDDHQLAFRVGTAALILILLDGGLNTPMRSIRVSLMPAAVLATFGVAATAGLTACFANFVGIPWPEAMLLGAVVSSTDAAAVFAVLRGSGLRLSERVGTTTELESGVNDPMAVILTVTVTELLVRQVQPSLNLAFEVPVQLLVGLGAGLAVGYGARLLLLRVRLSTAGLYPVLTLGLGFLAFGAATLLRGSGFLAAFTAAILLGNGPLPYRGGLLRIHDALAWLSQVAMFLMLGLLVTPSQLVPVAGQGLLIAVFLTFVARPLAVVACLAPFRFPPREVVFIGWVGLRGAVPIILAIYPVLMGVPGAMNVFNIVFFVVAVNAVLPGITIRWITRRLGLQADHSPLPLAAVEINSTRLLKGEVLTFYVTDALAVCNAAISEIPFPSESAVVLIVRDEELLAARGSTVLRPGDHVCVFCRPEDRAFIELLFGRPHQEE